MAEQQASQAMTAHSIDDSPTTPMQESGSSSSSATANEGVSPEQAEASTMPQLAAQIEGPDLSRPKTIVHRLTFGIIADPWITKPWGIRWRSSPWFLTAVVSIGVATDLITYTIVVPVLPFRLQALGYENISTLTSVLLICYSAGLAVATPPMCFYFFRYPYRRAPLLVALIILQLALVLFMLARPFWCMCVSRVLQGLASAAVWNVGFALICENVPHEHVGKHIGFAMSGVTIGTTIGPLLGGVLYDSLGWHSPFILCIIICAFDFLGRLLLVERKEVKRWGIGVGEDLRSINDDIGAGSGEQDEEVKATSSANEKRRPAVPSTNDDSLSLDPSALGGDKPPKGILIKRPNLGKGVSQTDRGISYRSKKPKQLTPIGVIIKLCSSPRAVTGFGLCFAYGLIIGSEDPVLTLRVEDVWHKNSLFIGIIYLIASIPSFFTGPIAGAIADRWGAEVLAAGALVLASIWQPLLSLKQSLAAFIVFFTLSNGLMSCVMSPVGRELAVVAKGQEGIGEIHQFGAFNMAFAISTCIGPIFGGQIYDHVANGWTVLCWLWFAILLICLPPALWYTGDRPLGKRLYWRLKKRRADAEANEHGMTPVTTASQG